jgi:glycosyltransferase involved in cell wall biosynthesis
MTNVTLVVTTLNEAAALPRLLDALLGQMRPLDELILVDGGSTDGTVAVAEQYQDRLPLRILVRPGCNISEGRNEAIAAASHELIAVTDAGCRPAPDWLAHLVAPLQADEAVGLVSGRVEPEAYTHLEACIGRCSLAFQAQIGGVWILPTARTLAFRRAVWERVGGFPAQLSFGEDAAFVVAAAAITPIHVATESVTFWRPRSTYGQLMRQFFHYADGLAQAGLSRQFHLKTVLQSGGMAAGVGWGLLSRRKWSWLVGMGIGAAYLWRKAQAGCFDVPGWRTFYRVPLVLLAIHLGTMAGVIRGNLHHYFASLTGRSFK